MKSFVVFALFVVGSTVAFPWPWQKRQAQYGNGVQAFDEGSNWPSVSFSFDLKFMKLGRFYAHLTKSYVDADILTTYFNLPDSERQCIETFMDNAQEKYKSQNITEEQYLNDLKAACPNSASAIQTLHEKIKAMMERYSQKYQDFVNNLPQSFKDANTKLNNALMTLFKNDQFKNITALHEILVPALESIKAINGNDARAVADKYPLLAPIITGDKAQALNTLIQAAIDSINNGKPADQKAVEQAFQQLGEYLKWVVQQVLSDIDHAQEAQLPANVDQALKATIAHQLAKSFQMLAKIPFLKINTDEANDVYEISY